MKTESRYADYDHREFHVVTPQRAAAEDLRDVALAPPAIDLAEQGQAEIEAAIGAWMEDWWIAKRRADAALAAIDPYPQPSHVSSPLTADGLANDVRDWYIANGYDWNGWG